MNNNKKAIFATLDRMVEEGIYERKPDSWFAHMEAEIINDCECPTEMVHAWLRPNAANLPNN